MNEFEDRKLKSFLKENSASPPITPQDEWESIRRKVEVQSEKPSWKFWKWNLIGLPAGALALALALFVWNSDNAQPPNTSDDELSVFLFSDEEDFTKEEDNEGAYYLGLIDFDPGG